MGKSASKWIVLAAAVLFSGALAGECLAKEGKVKLQLGGNPDATADNEIEIIRVKDDGTTETVNDTNGKPLRGKPADLVRRTEDKPNGTGRVRQDPKDAAEHKIDIVLPPGTYIIRVTNAKNKDPDRTVDTPKFRVPEDAKVKIAVRLEPGSEGGQVDIPPEYRVAEAAGTSQTMAPIVPTRPALTFNVGLLTGFSIGGADVKITQDVAATKPFHGDNGSAGAIVAADIYFLADLGRIADVPPIAGRWAPKLWAGAFAGVRGLGGQDDFSHRLDLVNPIEPDTDVQIGGASGFWAPYLGLSIERVDEGRERLGWLTPTKFGFMVGAHQSNTSVDVDFEQPGGHTRFHLTEDSYNPMIGIRVDGEAPFELLGSEVYLNLVYFHVFGTGGSEETKKDQFGHDVTVKVDAGNIDVFMLGASVPFTLLDGQVAP